MTIHKMVRERNTPIDRERVENALDRINPVELDYDTWLRVGMALKSAGCACADWERWSERDPQRFQEGECRRKWDGFHGEGVGIGTLFALARPWEGTVSGAPPGRPAPGKHPAHGADAQDRQLAVFLRALFEANDIVRIVSKTYLNNGRTAFTRGSDAHTRDALLARISRGGVNALGPFGPAGGWCAANPLDGKGVKAANVARFRHTLVESDALPVEEQERLIRALKLPVTTLVHSGGKSIHALVRVDAANRQEFDGRVKRLHEICNKAGLKVDPACKDPGRLTRLPGVLRNGTPQRLLAAHIGCDSWDAWIKAHEAPGTVFTPTRIAGSGPMPEPLFHNGPIPGALGLFIGEDGIGKGWLTLDLLLSCVLGRTVNLHTLGYRGSPMRVVYLCYEDMCPVLEWRLDRICERADIDPGLWRRAESAGLLTVKALPRQPGHGEDDLVPLFRQEEHGAPLFTPFFTAVERYLSENQTNLCIIDPLAAAAILANENDNASMNTVAVQLRALAAKTRCTVLLTHHTSKAAHGIQHHHAARGGSALPGAARWQLQLAQEQHDGPLFLSISKNSYGKRKFDIQLRREENGVLVELTRRDIQLRARELMYKVIAWIKAHPGLVINHNAVKNNCGDAKYLVDAMAEALGAKPKEVYDAIEAARLDDLLRITEMYYKRKLIKRITAPGAAEGPPLAARTPEESDEDEEEIPFV